MIKINGIPNTYLYEIIEDYKDSKTAAARNSVLSSFYASIWGSPNKRRIYIKTIRFEVKKNLRETELGKIFDLWSALEYTGYRPRTIETDYASLIRQKINNIYTRLFEPRVILKAEYINLLKTPKQLYYRWIAGESFTASDVTEQIDTSIHHAKLVKEKYQQQKMSLSWDSYKKIVEDYFIKIFDNCKMLDDYANADSLTLDMDCWNEDNFYISYFCKTLEGYFKNYQKEYYGLSRGRRKTYSYCEACGALFEKTGRNHKYCIDCKKKKQLEWQRQAMKNARQSTCEVL